MAVLVTCKSDVSDLRSRLIARKSGAPNFRCHPRLASGPARKAHTTHWGSARWAKVHSSRHACAAAHGILRGRCRISLRTGRIFRAPIRGNALRLVFVAGIGWRRALYCGSCLPAGMSNVPGALRPQEHPAAAGRWLHAKLFCKSPASN